MLCAAKPVAYPLEVVLACCYQQHTYTRTAAALLTFDGRLCSCGFLLSRCHAVAPAKCGAGYPTTPTSHGDRNAGQSELPERNREVQLEHEPRYAETTAQRPHEREGGIPAIFLFLGILTTRASQLAPELSSTRRQQNPRIPSLDGALRTLPYLSGAWSAQDISTTEGCLKRAVA